MADDRIVLDELHLTILVRKTMPDATVTKARRTLRSGQFRAGLRRAVDDLVARHSSLTNVRITISP